MSDDAWPRAIPDRGGSYGEWILNFGSGKSGQTEKMTRAVVALATARGGLVPLIGDSFDEPLLHGRPGRMAAVADAALRLAQTYLGDDAEAQAAARAEFDFQLTQVRP